MSQLVCLPAALGTTTTSSTTPSTSTTTTVPRPCDELSSQCPDASATCPPDQECGSIGRGQCACIPKLPKACGDTEAGECATGVCPPGLVCAELTVCGCLDPSLVPCGTAALPQCDGVCPPGLVCNTFDFGCACWIDFGPCGQSTFNSAAPQCNGDCPSPSAPYCRDVGGTCMCAP